MKNLIACSFLLALACCSSCFAQSSGSPDPLAPTLHTKSADQIDQEWQQSVAKYDKERNRLLDEADC